MKKNLFNVLCLVFLCHFVSGQTPVLVEDIYKQRGQGSFPDDLTVFKGKLYFTASDSAHGNELWSYDGVNPPGMVADIGLGFYAARSAFISDLTVFRDKLYFSANDSTHGPRLWVYDGANPPSFAVTDTNLPYGIGITDFIVFKDKLYFKKGNNGSIQELYVYDGTNLPSEVAVLDKDGITINNSPMFIFNDKLYFVGRAGKNDSEDNLYEFDGTSASVLLYDVEPNLHHTDVPEYIGEYNNELYFYGNNGTGYQIMVYDGTNDPIKLEERTGWTAFNYTKTIKVAKELKGKFYLTSPAAAKSEIWEYDGKNAPTKLYTLELVYDHKVYRVNNRLYFVEPATNEGGKMWSFDGVNHPVLIDFKDYLTKPLDELTGYRGDMYFRSGNDSLGLELFKFINCSYSSTIDTTICGSYTSPSGKYLWRNSGIYVDTIPSPGGCDSIITIKLSVMPYLAGDNNCNGVIDYPTEICGDIDGDGKITSPEIAGDKNGDKETGEGEKAGDTDGSGEIDGEEEAGDTNGNGSIDFPGEVSGDIDGDGKITSPEIAGDKNGDKEIGDGEKAGDTDGSGDTDGEEEAGDTNGNGSIDFPGEVSGDIDGDGKITSPEIAGDKNGDKEIGEGEKAGDTDGSGDIDGEEEAGDTNGNGSIDFPGEVSGDIDGDGKITSPEIAGDKNGDKEIGEGEKAGDTDGSGDIDGKGKAGDTNGNGGIDYPGEKAGDTSGDGEISGEEKAGDLNGNGTIDDEELEGDENGNGVLDGNERSSAIEEISTFIARVYPIPALEKLYIELFTKSSEVEVQLVSLTGQIIVNEQVYNETLLALEIGAIPSGLYILGLKTTNGFKEILVPVK